MVEHGDAEDDREDDHDQRGGQAPHPSLRGTLSPQAERGEISGFLVAKLVKESGLRGVVASPQEIRAIREACGDDFAIVTPGIRPAGSDAGDQQRTMTPRDAMEAGADYIVIGRPIIAASKPRDAAMRIIESL